MSGRAKNDNPRAFDINISDPKARIQKFIDSYSDNDGYESNIMHNTRVISTQVCSSDRDGMQAKATFETDVVPGLCNAMKNMHGGATATLADMTTTMTSAPIASPGWWEFSGVSRTLNVTYIRPIIPQGTTVVIECALRSAGKRLSVTQCSMRDKKTGALLALAEHGKAALAEQTKTKL